MFAGSQANTSRHANAPDRPLETEDDAPDKTPFVDDQLAKESPEDERRRRHAVLMDCLADERDRTAEERIQASIDEDMYDHLQWRPEDAQVLIDRGQLPLVFNESRQTIDWIAGTEKRMRKDYKVLPREKNDEQGAEVKTQVVKYTDDVNLTEWHVSKAFKQASLSGLSWLEEGINVEPGEEIIFAGSEDWRNVYRDSRSRLFDLKDARYLFRRKVVDLDYAQALLPKASEHLRAIAHADETMSDDDIWYLGERLTGASDILNNDGLPSSWRDRRAYVSNSYDDRGRRTAVELLECWYRVPQTVKVFQAGPLYGKIVNLADPGHVQLVNDKTAMYEAVKMRMRAMIATKDKPLWDGTSPFRHGNFTLIPLWGYRRYRDGMTYGAMRGMRDLQDDMNKRASKALWLLSANRIVMDEGAVDDLEEARQEAARPDGIIVKKANKELRFEKPTAEIQGNLEMMDRDSRAMRNVGGVTDENLGRDTNAQSGIAIERKQDQGSLTSSELFDNRLLARKLAGRLRLSHIEQFWTQEKAIRIVGEGAPMQWLDVNKIDPDNPDGPRLNDLNAREADFHVAEQDYRESYTRAAMEQMFELLGQIATYAPNVVLAVLDLAVDSAEIKNKDEWVARIRKLNGQRDPTKAPTPEEQQKAFADAQKAALMDQMGMEQLKLQLQELQAKISKLDTEAISKRVDAMFAALQAAQIVAITPAVATVGDTIMAGAGFKDQNGQDPNLPTPAQPAQPPATPPQQPGIGDPGAQVPNDQPTPPNDAQPQGLEGVNGGIQTPTAADNGPAM
jgi:hypothetical protein